jgi:hypothetical protein
LDLKIRVFHVNGIKVGRDTQPSETFTTEQSRELDIAATSARKAMLAIDKIPTIVRSATGYFVNFEGRLEQAPVKGTRRHFNPGTLAPLGFLIEEQRKNILSNTNNLFDGNWV